MEEKTPADLTQDLFKLVKRLPNLKLRQTVTGGLTRSEYELLALLRMNIDGHKAASVSDISNWLQITPAGVTHLVNPLEEKGFIERLPDSHDRRVVRIGLTHTGVNTAEAFIADVQTQLAGLVNHLGEEDSKTFVRLLSRALEFFASQFDE